MKYLAVALGLGVSVLSACTPGETEKTMGSHKVKFIPGSMMTTSSHMTTGSGPSLSAQYELTCGDNKISIIDEELLVNRKTYGKLNASDSIVVDHGKVLVNGKEVQGTALTKEDEKRLALSEEIVDELAGHVVTVRPGSNFCTKVSGFGKHTLTAGDTEVVIRANALHVNGKPYGTLKKGDSITVDFGTVSVSGTERVPTE